MSISVTAAPGAGTRNSVRPPTGSGHPAPPPGVAVPAAEAARPTVSRRPLVAPVLWDGVLEGFPTYHPYVRRFWTAAIGSGAVADLMRLAVAAQRGRSLPLPTNVSLLSREGLVSWSRGRLLAGVAVPPLPERHVRRMAPTLRREHGRAVANLRIAPQA